jgi:hypothetical protein
MTHLLANLTIELLICESYIEGIHQQPWTYCSYMNQNRYKLCKSLLTLAILAWLPASMVFGQSLERQGGRVVTFGETDYERPPIVDVIMDGSFEAVRRMRSGTKRRRTSEARSARLLAAGRVAAPDRERASGGLGSAV